MQLVRLNEAQRKRTEKEKKNKSQRNVMKFLHDFLSRHPMLT